MQQNSKVGKCYMHELGSCGGKISREHLISESIIDLLSGGEDFSISGLPWLKPGEEKILAPGNLTAHCLCRDHNSALSPLDTAALIYFRALKTCLEQEATSLRKVVSGHDIERWLLKSIKAMAVSGNLGRGQQRLPGLFAGDVRIIDMLDEPRSWPKGAGLYCRMQTGDRTENNPRFQMQPYTNSEDELYGLGFRVFGLDFALILQEPDASLLPHTRQWVFRPGMVTVKFSTAVNHIMISWEDGLRHRQFIALKEEPGAATQK
jgi:hypothetical protein